MKRLFRFLTGAFTFVRSYFNRTVFIAIHLAVLTVFFVPFSLFDLWLLIGFFFLGMFGISAGYHRLLSHRSYGANRLMRFALAFIGCTAAQKGPIWWAKQHIDHHLYTDTPKDRHSPVSPYVSFWHGHIGWLFSKKEGEHDYSCVKHLTKHWEMRLLERFNFVPALLLLWLCWFLDGWSGVIWGFVVRTVVLYHSTFAVNSVCHWSWFGYRKFDTPDHSRNVWWLTLFTLGEEWHNDHHKHQGRSKQGVGWWKIDCSWYLLWFFWVISGGKLVWGLHKPIHKPQKELAGIQ